MINGMKRQMLRDQYLAAIRDGEPIPLKAVVHLDHEEVTAALEAGSLEPIEDDDA